MIHHRAGSRRMVEALLLRKPANHHLLYRLETKNTNGWLNKTFYQGQLYWGNTLLVGHGKLQTSPEVWHHYTRFLWYMGVHRYNYQILVQNDTTEKIHPYVCSSEFQRIRCPQLNSLHYQHPERATLINIGQGGTSQAQALTLLASRPNC